MSDPTMALYERVKAAHGERAADRWLAAERANARGTPVERDLTADRPAKAPEPPPVASGGADAPLTLRLPLPLNRANQRGFSIARYREDCRLFDACDRTPNVPPPAVPFARVALAWHVEHGATAPCDWDNLHARLKPLQDWLVRRGYLVDDSPAVIPTCPTITQRAKVRPPLRRVLVTITPLAPATEGAPCPAA